MRKPNFFIVGAPKCATTSVTEFLRGHPDIFLPAGKEYTYFGTDLDFQFNYRYIEEEREYLHLYENVPGNKIAGESSIWYLYSQSAPQEIKQFNPEAKIIICLRNPVDMMYSLHRQLVYAGSEPIQDFQEALQAEKRRKQGKDIPPTVPFPRSLLYSEMGTFSPHIQRYLNVFGQKNTHFIITEKLAKKPGKVAKNLQKFLEAEVKEDMIFPRTNKNKEERFPGLNKIIRNPNKWPGNWIKSIFNSFPPAFQRKLLSVYRKLNSTSSPKEPLSDQLRKRLQNKFSPEIKKVNRIIERDLDCWQNHSE